MKKLKTQAVLILALLPVVALATVKTQTTTNVMAQSKVPQSAIKPAEPPFEDHALFSLNLNPNFKTDIGYVPSSNTSPTLKLPANFPYENQFAGDLTLGFTYHFD